MRALGAVTTICAGCACAYYLVWWSLAGTIPTDDASTVTTDD